MVANVVEVVAQFAGYRILYIVGKVGYVVIFIIVVRSFSRGKLMQTSPSVFVNFQILASIRSSSFSPNSLRINRAKSRGHAERFFIGNHQVHIQILRPEAGIRG